MAAELPAHVREGQTWTSMLAWWSGRDETAVIIGETRWSGADLLAHSAGAAAHLTELTRGPGAVAALVTATPGTFAYLIAGSSIDRPLAPLGPRLTCHELAPSIGALGAEVLLTEVEFLGLASELAEMTGVRVEVVGEPPQIDAPLNVAVDELAPAFILHTSGTTGAPKAVAFRQDIMARRVRMNSTLTGVGPGSVYTSASPLHHIAGFGSYAVALAAGAAVVPMGRFTVEGWASLGPLGVTHVTTVPTVIELLLDAGVLALPDLEMMQYGASPMHPSTLRRLIDALPDVDLVHLYGQTEGSPITALSPEDHRWIVAEGRDDLLKSVGRAINGVEMHLEDIDPDGVGEVVARAGHFCAPGPDGWLHTGDLGRLDDDGFLFLAGRKGDMIIRGGENIYPVEVEQAIERHPQVREACVVGVSDVKWGERVKAFIVPEDLLSPPDLEELRAHTRVYVSGFKVPTEWELREELPRNAGGKLLRRQLT